MPLIEVTRVEVVSGGVVPGDKTLIQTDQIVMVTPGGHGTSQVTLAGDTKLTIKEGYEDLKKRLGVS